MKKRIDEINGMRRLMGLSLIKEQENNEIYHSKCSGEVWNSDVCTGEEGGTPSIVIDLANRISDSCNCFALGDWDEEKVKEYLLKVPDQYKEEFSNLLYCYMKSMENALSSGITNTDNPVITLIDNITPDYQKKAAEYSSGKIGDDTDWSEVINKFN